MKNIIKTIKEHFRILPYSTIAIFLSMLSMIISIIALITKIIK